MLQKAVARGLSYILALMLSCCRSCSQGCCTVTVQPGPMQGCSQTLHCCPTFGP